MALRPVGTQFVTKGFNSFVRQLRTVDKSYQALGKQINLTGNDISAFGAKLRVFTRGGKAYSQWVDEATGSFMKHDEVQKRFRAALNASRGDLVKFAQSFTLVNLGPLSVAIAGLVAAFAGLKIGINIVKGVIGGLISLAKTAISPLVKLKDVILDLVNRVGGFFLGDIFAGLTSALQKLKTEMVGTVSNFQRLEIQYESLIARQLRAEDSTLSVAKSLGMASVRASKLLDWVKQIAVTTPFEVETIASTVAFSQAMGFTVNQSKLMTTAIINFTSAMGLGQETMDRIIQNFGQMRAAGKVTGTELRDLARGALLPVNDIMKRMAENMGIAKEDFEDFRKAASEGAAPVDEFFKAFIDLANESFPNAAERMSRTFEGVKNNIIDFFKTIVGVEALGPVFNRITALMADALDNLLTPAVRRTAAIVGEALLQGFNQIWEAIQTKLVPAFNNLKQALGLTGADGFTFATVIAKISATISVAIDKISQFVNWLSDKLGGKFTETADNARSWGYNIIASLADGMARAAKVVVDVLIQLGNLIAEWLMPGSPPKLLPKLDKWGAEAMTEYMKGWALADFNVFNDISKTIESFIRSISTTILDQTDVVPAILDFRDRLAQAMNEIAQSGNVATKTLKSIFSALRGGSPELRKYVQLQIELAKASKIAENAQKELNDVTEKYDNILKPLQQRLDRINDLTSDVDDARKATQLRLILADVNASEGDKQRARLELERMALEKNIRAVENEKEGAVSAAEEKLKAAEDARDALEEQMKTQEALINMQIDTNNLIREQLDLLESLKETAEGMTDIFDGFGGFGEEGPERQVSGLLDTYKDKVSEIFENMRINVEEDIDAIVEKFSFLEDDLETLKETWMIAFGNITNEVNKWRGTLMISSYLVSDGIDRMKKSVSEALSELGIDFGENFSIIQFILDMVRMKILYFAFIFDYNMRVMANVIDWFTDKWRWLNRDIREIVDDIVGAIVTFLANIVAKIYTYYPKMVRVGKLLIQGLWNGIKLIWEKLWKWAQEHFGWLVDLIADISDEQSPSKVMAKHGENLMLGLAKGMEKAFSVPQKIMENMAMGLVSAPQMASSSTVSNVTNNNFSLSMATTQSPSAVQRSFDMMRIMSA